MKSGALVRIAVVTAAVIAATLILPWWSVAVVGLTVGLFFPAASPLEAGVSGLLGWAALLGLAAWQGPMAVLLGRLGILFHLPAAGLPLMALALAALLCWSAARVARAIRTILAGSARPA